jgi:hypothetical protein
LSLNFKCDTAVEGISPRRSWSTSFIQLKDCSRIFILSESGQFGTVRQSKCCGYFEVKKKSEVGESGSLSCGRGTASSPSSSRELPTSVNCKANTDRWPHGPYEGPLPPNQSSVRCQDILSPLSDV